LNTTAVLAIVGLGCAVAVNPPGVSLVILFLMSKDGMRKAWIYVAGSFAVETLIVLTAMFALLYFGNVAVNPSHSAQRGDAFFVLEALFGVSMLITGWLMLTRAQVGTSGLVSRAMKDIDAVPGWLAFAIGATLVSWTMPVVVGGQLVEAQDPMTLRTTAILFAIYMALALSSVLFPILVVKFRPEGSEQFLLKARAWVEKHGGRVAGWMTVVFGVVFAYLGVSALLAP
jgi:hypothetical protein